MLVLPVGTLSGKSIDKCLSAGISTIFRIVVIMLIL
jgi:hypothetical protein